MTQTVKSLPEVWETWVQSLCWEDILEKEMATHSSILTWRSPWTWDRKESDTTERLHFSLSYMIYGPLFSHIKYRKFPFQR